MLFTLLPLTYIWKNHFFNESAKVQTLSTGISGIMMLIVIIVAWLQITYIQAGTATLLGLVTIIAEGSMPLVYTS